MDRRGQMLFRLATALNMANGNGQTQCWAEMRSVTNSDHISDQCKSSGDNERKSLQLFQLNRVVVEYVISNV